MKIRISIYSVTKDAPVEVMMEVVREATLAACRKLFLREAISHDRIMHLAAMNATAAGRNLTKVLR